MLSTINSRAALPTDLKAIQRDFNISYRTLLSVNPKTEKSAVQTYILHLAPHTVSGINVCPGAGNCKKICLHFAGNPVYMKNKQSARIRKTLAYASDPNRFMRFILCAILDKINKNKGETLAIRLNGTSDILWENVDFTITPEFATFCRIKFGAVVPIGKRNIFEVFNFMRENTGENIVFYDYTKVRHNWAECKRLGYHLTFSFDGWNNPINLKLCREAIANGVNVAAAFNLKKKQELPAYISCKAFYGGDSSFAGRVFNVQDGDLSDYRPNDQYGGENGGSIIGLRFKLPHGVNYTAEEKAAFCIA